MSMQPISPNAYGGQLPIYTSLGATTANGGFSNRSFGAQGILGFGFPSFGDPMFYQIPAASSFFLNRLLGFANKSAVNINFGPVPSTLGFGGLLLGEPFFNDGGDPGQQSQQPQQPYNPYGGGFGGGYNPYGGGWQQPQQPYNPYGGGFGGGYNPYGGGFGGGYNPYGGQGMPFGFTPWQQQSQQSYWG